MANKKKTSNKKKLKLKNPFIELKKITKDKEKNEISEKKEKNVNDKKLRKYKVRNIILITLMGSGIAILSSIIIFFLFIVLTTEKFDPDKLLNRESTILYDINGNEFARLGIENRDTVSYEDLPQVLIDAIVATEDSRFFQHNGLDIARFAKATFGQITGQAGAGGASTLTMQIAKMSFNGTESQGFNGIVRKFRDIYLSVFKIEKYNTKEQIMEYYVNTPNLGWQTYGVEQASQTYFGKSVKDLTLAEASLLAGIFNAPTAYNPFSNLELATKRRSVVLNLMVHHGYITEEQRQDAENISVESLLNPNPKIGLNPYQPFIDVVTKEVQDREGVDPAMVSMEIYTTLDPDIQDVLNAINNEEEICGTKENPKKCYEWINDLVQIAVAITSTKDGSIVAINGGRNYNQERMWNLATAMKRHPGSTAKPIVAYGPYIEYNNGSTYTPFFDEPMTYSNGTSIKNAAGDYIGMISMRTALRRSRNIPAVQAFQQTDPEKIAEFVDNLHIKYGNNGIFESMAIGGFDGTSALDLSAAYAAFGRGGYYIEPYSFTKIIYTNTGEEKEFKYEPEKAMSEETAYLISDILVTATKNGVGGNINTSGRDIASKTGTSTYDSNTIKNYKLPSSAARDNWTNIYSPEYSMSVWYGYTEPMTDYYTTAMDGAREKTKITTVLANKIFTAKSKFKQPSNVVSSKVELETFPAQLPSENTPSDLISTELFIKGTEPVEESKRFSKLNAPTNGKATNNGTTVVLSWDPIPTPDAINEAYLQEFFNENYMDYAEKYYNKRIEYNNNHIGTLGYQVYQNVNGNLVSLGYTSSPTYSTTCIGDCIFEIKSAYSIFKNNISDSLVIKVNTNNNEPETPINPDTPNINNPNDLTAEILPACLPVSDIPYNDEEYSKTSNPIKVFYKGQDVTNEATIKRTAGNIIDRTKPSENIVKYEIIYNDIKIYPTRKIKINNNCGT
ncbi:MAG: transglycosylase domain-containing protein [Bacilli bacterium]